MQAKKPTFAEQQLLAPIPTQDIGKAEAQLAAIFSEIHQDSVQAGQAEPQLFHFNVARALRGFRIMDLAALAVGGLGAWALALTVNILFLSRFDLGEQVYDGLVKFSQSMLVGCCVIVWFAHSGHYRLRMPFWTETKKIFEAMGFAMLIDIFFRFVVKQDFSRLWLISGWIFAAIGMVAFRSLWRDYMRAKGLWNVATLLIGGGETANEARSALASEPGLGFDLVAQVGNLPVAFQQAGHSWANLCSRHQVDYVIIALDGNELVSAEQAFAQLMREDVPFSVSPPLHNVPVLGMVPQYFFNHDVMLLTHNHGLNQRMPRYIKRSFDVVVASCALLVLSPLLLTVALIVKKDGGPALFGHKRLGYKGNSFPCLKFRSMIVNSDAALKKYLTENPGARDEWARDHKLRDDPRVTAIGKFLRKTSIDELPQLLNVLKGDMSIVGPRPIIVAETRKYDSDISHYYRVRPGITGLWQVSGRNDVSYAQRVRMDSWYVRNWSLWHDIAIICKTFPAVLKRDGAY
jgi:Undecaprenyl-phosphate galactose phosphotransferase WbaP